VFSTGISPALVARVARALELVAGPEGESRRERVWANARRLLRGLGVSGEPPSPIVPVLVGDNARAVRVADALLERGWHVQAIRPPTVPVGTARLRLTVSAAHEPEQIDGLTHDLLEILASEGLPLRVERGSSVPRATDAAETATLRVGPDRVAPPRPGPNDPPTPTPTRRPA
jgi:8-amino-7-oxononanoate synthase